MRKLVLIVAFLTFASTAYAERTWTERYVDFANGNDANTCTNDGADECKTVQRCADVATSGMRCNIEWDSSAMTQTLTASIDIDTNTGTADDPIIFQGYSATPGDGTYAIIDGNSAAANIFNWPGPTTPDFIHFRHLELTGSTSHAMSLGSAASNIRVAEVKITLAGDDGINSGTSLNIRIVGSQITGTTGDGIDINSESGTVLSSNIHDTTANGVVLRNNLHFFAENIVDTTAHNLLMTNQHNVIIGNTLYNATGAGSDNISMDVGEHQHIIINNNLSTAADYNFDINAGNEIDIIANNNLHAGTTGTIDNAALISIDLGGQQTVDPQFTDAANQDFNIGANLDDDGYPTTYLGAASTTANREIGAVMLEETGGGGCTDAFGVIQ